MGETKAASPKVQTTLHGGVWGPQDEGEKGQRAVAEGTHRGGLSRDRSSGTIRRGSPERQGGHSGEGHILEELASKKRDLFFLYNLKATVAVDFPKQRTGTGRCVFSAC